MALADLFLDVLCGRGQVPPSLEVALLRNGREVNVAGYRRAVISKGEWQVRGLTARREVEWAGFGAPVEFDATALMRGQDALKVWSEASVATVPVGMGYRTTIELNLEDV